MIDLGIKIDRSKFDRAAFIDAWKVAGERIADAVQRGDDFDLTIERPAIEVPSADSFRHYRPGPFVYWSWRFPAATWERLAADQL